MGANRQPERAAVPPADTPPPAAPPGIASLPNFSQLPVAAFQYIGGGGAPTPPTQVAKVADKFENGQSGVGQGCENLARPPAAAAACFGSSSSYCAAALVVCLRC